MTTPQKSQTRTIYEAYKQRHGRNIVVDGQTQIVALIVDYFSVQTLEIMFQGVQINSATEQQEDEFNNVYRNWVEIKKQSSESDNCEKKRDLELTEFIQYLIDVHGEHFEIKKNQVQNKDLKMKSQEKFQDQQQGSKAKVQLKKQIIQNLESQEKKKQEQQVSVSTLLQKSNLVKQKNLQKQFNFLSREKNFKKSQKFTAKIVLPNKEDSLQQNPSGSYIRNSTQTHKSASSSHLFRSKEEKYLSLYYKHFSQNIDQLPKGQTFDNIKQLYQTMNFTQWMQFTKAVGLNKQLEQIYKNKNKSLNFFKKVYMNYEDNSKRVDFKNFCAAVASIVQILPTLSLQKDTIYWKKLLGISGQSENLKKLEQLGIPFTKEKTMIFKEKTLHSKSKFGQKQNKLSELNSKNQYIRFPSIAQTKSLSASQYHSANGVLAEKKKNVSTRKFKYYLNHEDRKQSMIMKKLTLQNLSKINPNDEIKNNLNSLVGEQDYYLREYTKRQDRIKKGVLKRLEDQTLASRTKTKGRAMI